MMKKRFVPASIIFIVAFIVSTKVIIELKNSVHPSFQLEETSIRYERDAISIWNKKWENASLLPSNLYNGKNFTLDVASLVSFWEEYWSPFKREVDAKLIWPHFMNAVDLFDHFPTPVSKDTIQIYNQKAYHEMVQLFIEREDTIRICANGGSPTAGEGVGSIHLRFFNMLTKYIQDLNLNPANATLEILDRGHGGRDSMHSAILAPNFFPSNTDIVFWEFSINDHFRFIKSPHDPKSQMRSIFIAWLREMEKIKPRPPKVIIVYLWGFNFEWNGETQKSFKPVYEAHAHLAKEFDFVVGFINAASYYDELAMSHNDIKQIFFADMNHPNETGNLVIAFLLLNLFRGQGMWNDDGSETSFVHSNVLEMKNAKGTLVPKHDKVEMVEWYCNTSSQKGKLVSWKSPLGVASLEEPNNNHISELIPRQLAFDLDPKAQIKTFGRASPTRYDRKKAIPLACCASTTDDNAYHTNKRNLTSVIVSKGAKSMQNVSSIFFGFHKDIHTKKFDFRKIKVYFGSSAFNDNAMEVSGKLYSDNCPAPWPWYSSLWIDLESEHQNVSSIHMCIENKYCEDYGQSEAMIMTVIVS